MRLRGPLDGTRVRFSKRETGRLKQPRATVGKFDDETHRRFEHFGGFLHDARDAGMEETRDALWQTVVAKRERATEHADGAALDFQRSERARRLVVLCDRGVEPAQLRETRGFGIAAIGERGSGDIEDKRYELRWLALGCDYGSACVATGRYVRTDIERAPERLDTTRRDVDMARDGFAIPVHPGRLQAAEAHAPQPAHIGETHAQITQLSARGPNAKLKREELVLPNSKLRIRRAFEPKLGHVIEHPHRALASLGENCEGRSRTWRQPCRAFRCRGDDFHFGKAIVLGACLPAHHLRIDRRGDSRLPSCIRRILRREIFCGRKGAAARRAREEIHPILTRCCRLENDIASFRGNIVRHDIHHTLPRRRLEHEHTLFLRLPVAPPPR